MTTTTVVWQPMIRKETMYRPRLIGAILILLFNIFDIILTYWAISKGASEANPLMAWLVETKWMIPLKISIATFIVYAADRHREKTNMAVLCSTWLIAGVYACVVLVNLMTLMRLG